MDEWQVNLRSMSASQGQNRFYVNLANLEGHQGRKVSRYEKTNAVGTVPLDGEGLDKSAARCESPRKESAKCCAGQ